MSDVTVIMAVRDEPIDRVERGGGTGREEGNETIELLIAAPAAEHDHLSRVVPSGAVENVHLVDNPSGERSPRAQDRAPAAATADVVVRLDARSVLPTNYVARCIDRLTNDRHVGVVGGVQRPTTSSRGPRNVRSRGVGETPGCSGAPPTGVRAMVGRPTPSTSERFAGPRCRRSGTTSSSSPTRTSTCAPGSGRTVRRCGSKPAWRWATSHVRRTAICGSSTSRSARRRLASGVAVARCAERRQFIALAGAAGGAALAVSQFRHPVRVVALAAAGVAGGAVVDHVADPEEPDELVRAHAVAASMTIVGGWLCGLVAEALNGRRRVS